MEYKQDNYMNLYNKSVIELNNKNSKYKKYREEWKNNPIESKIAQFPLNVDIELTNACNLKCPYCARTHKRWGDNTVGFMDKNLAKKILDEINAENGYCVKFSLRGEPLMHKDIVEILEYASKTNLIDYYFNTNGSLLTEKLMDEFIRIKLPRISISVAGWDKESFEKSQCGANFEQVRENIIKFKKKRESAKSEFPKIRLQIVLTPDVLENIKKVEETWKNLGDELGGIEFREESEENISKEIQCSKFKCNFLWQRIVILWNGDVYPCLFHGVKDNKDILLGNIKKSTLSNLWNSEKMQHMRNLHNNGKSNEILSCSKCSYRDTEVEKIVKL